jgi:hypothetical protein
VTERDAETARRWANFFFFGKSKKEEGIEPGLARGCASIARVG